MYMPKRRHIVHSDRMDAKFESLPVEVVRVPVGDLNVDLTYQNELEPSVVEGMGRFLPVLALQLLVVRRADGSLYIVDGYHRWERATEDGEAEVECCVIDCDDRELEAYIFVRANSSVGQKASYALWHGWLATHDPRALDIERIIGAFDLTIGRRPMVGSTVVGCPWTIAKLYESGTLRTVCATLTAALPSPMNGYTRTHFEGIEYALKEGLTPEAIKYVFDTTHETGVEQAALGLAPLMENQSKARKYAAAIHTCWDRSRRPKQQVVATVRVAA